MWLARKPARAGQKARIHSGAVGGKQPGSGLSQGSGAGQGGVKVIEAERMGRYIDDILQPGEKVLYSTNAHWIFYLPAIAAWIVAIFLFFLSRQTTTESLVLLCLSAAAVVAIVALYWTAKAWFHRWTTETDVTNLRVVHNTGFIKRRTYEMSLDKVESVDFNQSILGRLLNYGNVTVRGVGEGAETIDTIASPLEFRNHITAR
jgi:membrane protein YdbS with pleckstrin-like domain